MSNFNTGNPVPSTDPRDLDDNATVFDLLLQSPLASVPDRLGVQRKTWAQMEDDAAALVSPNVAALAAVTPATDKGVYFSATVPVTMGTYTLTGFARGLSAAVDGPAFRGAIGAISSADSITGSAATLTTLRSISATGDATWSVNFDGSANATAAITLANSGVSAGTYSSVTVNAKGLVTAGAAPAAFTNLVLQNSWIVNAVGRRAGYRKFQDFVYLEVQITSGTATDGTLLATLPVGFRPPNSFAIPVMSAPNVAPAIGTLGPRVVVETDGSITCQNCSTGGIAFMIPFSLV